MEHVCPAPVLGARRYHERMTGLLLMILVLTLLFVTITGWRGRRVGTAPHCARCGFDLTGLYPDAPACPECGQALNALVVQFGCRERRWRRFWIGLGGLAAIALLVGLAARGVLSTQTVVARLPTGVLIAWGIERPGSIIGPEARVELMRRQTAARLSAAQEEALWTSIQAHVSQPGSQDLFYISDMVLALVQVPTTSATTRGEIAAFLLDCQKDPGRTWDRTWTPAAQLLREDGTISDSEWTAALAEACRPYVSRPGSAPLRAGEEFLICVNFNHRVTTGKGMHLIELDLPPGFSVAQDIGGSQRQALAVQDIDLLCGVIVGLGTPSLGTGGVDGPYHAVLRAPSEPGAYTITIRTRYSATPLRPTALVEAHTSGQPGALHEANIAVAVEGAPSDTMSSTDAIASWLQGRIFVKRVGGGSFSLGRERAIGHTLGFAVADGGLTGEGRFAVASPDGGVRELGRFWITPNSSRYTRAVGGGGSSGRPGNELSIPVPGDLAHPDSADRLLLLFDSVTLPDGRKHDGAAIEVEVPLPGFGPEPDW